MWKGWQAAPLSSSFMFAAILGFAISAIWVTPQSLTWGFTFLLMFSTMFIASVISMTHAPVRDLTVLDRRSSVKSVQKKRRR